MPLVKTQAEGINLADTFAFSGTVSGAGGITHLDQWRLTTNFTGGTTQVFANSERVDTTGQATIGSAMTQSSGVFTFPVTGKWLVSAIFSIFHSGDARYYTHTIQVTLDNSNFTEISQGNIHVKQTAEGGATYSQGAIQSTIDVTDTSNVKIRSTCSTSQSGVTTLGATGYNRTMITFIRFGDT